MKRYMKKPLIIEAEQLTEEKQIKTLEGTMKGNAGDWLIKGVNGELYPCKDEIFRKAYIPMDPNEKGFSKPFLFLTVNGNITNAEMMMPDMEQETAERVLAFIVQAFAKKLIDSDKPFREVHWGIQAAVNCGLTEAFQKAYDEERARNEANHAMD